MGEWKATWVNGKGIKPDKRAMDFQAMNFKPPDDQIVSPADSQDGAHVVESLAPDVVMAVLASIGLHGDNRLPGFA